MANLYQANGIVILQVEANTMREARIALRKMQLAIRENMPVGARFSIALNERTTIDVKEI